MIRQLYRIYLYVVSLALLVFAAIGLFMLVDTLLAFTPLRGSYRPVPSGKDLTQQIVFAAVAWLIAAALGALHYRLIRRDIASDPAAGSGAVRAFFLNLAQAVATLIAVVAATGAFTSLAYQESGPSPDSASAFATTISAALVAALLQVERSRTCSAPGLATTFQRLHLYGVPLMVLLSVLTGAWDAATKTSLEGLLIWAKIYNPLDPRACAGFPPKAPPTGPIEGPCALPNAGFLWLATLVAIAVIGLYFLLVRGDVRSILRAVAHLASFGVGVAFVLVGLDRALELGARALFGSPVGWSDIAHPWSAPYNFVSPVTFGLLTVLVYGLWLRAEASQLPLGTATFPTMEALAAALLAIPFYWGLGRALYTLFEWLASSAPHTLPAAWAAALALMLTGLGYVLLTLRLRIHSSDPAGVAPRRALVLTLLAGGIVSGGVGLAVTLFALGTQVLGAPPENWQQTARSGTAALLVGLVLVGVYGWITLRGGFIEPLMAGLSVAHAPPVASGSAQRVPTESQIAPELLESIGGVLDDYAAHVLDREDAVARIVELTGRR